VRTKPNGHIPGLRGGIAAGTFRVRLAIVSYRAECSVTLA